MKILLLQMLPILVFLVVDALVQDATWAIGSALAFVVLQSTITFARTRKIDPFILIDALLIGGLGAISLLSKDELFFKLKPAIIEGLMVPFLLVLAFGSERLITGYLGRYAIGGTSFRPEALPLVRRMLGMFAVLVLLHGFVVVYAALHWSRQRWGWVSGPGFYVILVPMLGWALYRRWVMRRSAATPAEDTEVGGTRRSSIRGRRRS